MKPLKYVMTLALIQGSFACHSEQVKKDQTHDINGVWFSQRDGEIKVIENETTRTIQVVNSTCYEVSNSLSYGTELSYEAIKQHSIRQDNQLILNILRPRPFTYTLISNINDVCTEGLGHSMVRDGYFDFDAQSMFDIYWQDMNNHYAFFDERNIDWDEVYDKYYDGLYGADDEQLINVFDEILRHLKDDHSSISIPSKELQIWYSNKSTLEQQLELEADQLNIPESEKESYITSQKDKITLNIMKYLFEHEQEGFKKRASRESKEHRLNWGIIDNKGIPTGYLRIGDFMSYIDEGLITETPKRNTDKAHRQFEELVTKILTQLNDTQSLIIDIRENEGGLDMQGLWLLQHLIEEQQLAWHVSSYFKGEFSHDVDVTMTPSDGISYTKPIVLLTSFGTVSAAETFASAMNTLPHVTIVGESTSGATSDAFGRMLPNGWEYSLSNLYYKNRDLENHEVTGVQPDHVVRNFVLEDRQQGRDVVLEKALSLLY
ncbi:S41 family peptidase [Vibrio sp. 10N.261.52.A1]|uniref:S41 family peptidase n=1 Tax=Vibrio TaxID=662 RepID=UPI000C860567|nr:S41 family peptidase [Vibrio sp. 10N.261.52.A1]PML54456.1 peptidase [Vibrio sp. 10N.261.52.A1]